MEQSLVPGTESSAEIPKAEEVKLAEIEKLSDIKRAEYNPRQISNWAKEALRKSMMKFGDLSGIVVNVRTGKLVGGHQRVSLFDESWRIRKQAILKDEVGTVAEGWVETPFGRWDYREVDWDEPTEIQANVAANKHGGSFDHNKLKKCIEKISADQLDFSLIGMDEGERAAYSAQVLSERKEDDNPVQKWADAYERGEIKQIVLYFPGAEFAGVLQRVERVMKELGVDNNTDTFVKLPERYEAERKS